MTNTTTAATESMGTCQICEKVCKMVRGLTSLHGYARPGHGWIEGRCMGAKATEWERSCDLLKSWVVTLESMLTSTERALVEASDPSDVRTYYCANYRGPSTPIVRPAVPVTTASMLCQSMPRNEKGHAEPEAHAEFVALANWEEERKRFLYETARRADALRSEIARQTARLAGWVATR